MENGTSPLLESVPNAYFQLTTAQMLVFGAITILTAQFLRGFFGGVKAPFVGYRSKWEPGLLVRLRFLTSGRSMIMDGYNRVCLKCVEDGQGERCLANTRIV